MLRSLILGSAASVILFCGGCGGGTSVGIDLTDAPPDTAKLESVRVTLAAVEVHVIDKGAKGDFDPEDKTIDKSDKWRTITPQAGTFDLLELQNDVTAPLGELEVPDGKITQIRLHIDPAGENRVVLKTGESCALDLTNVDKTGIKINHPFKAIDIEPGKHHRVVVDFDVKESVDQSGACTFSLKPVIKIKRASAS